MRPRRLLMTLALAAALAPSLWLRSEAPRVKASPFGHIEPLAHQAATAGPFRLEGAWEISGSGSMFGGFSALITLPGDRFLAGTDGGRKLVFLRPDRPGPPALFSRFGTKADVDKLVVDLEALTRDPDTGVVWGAYEASNAIRRFGADLAPQGKVRPRAMREWGLNSGAEAFTRLPDGRFLAVEERAEGWGSEIHKAVLFAGDPLEDKAPRILQLAVPGNYRPVDMIATGDGRVLVLLRELVISLPPGFRTAIGEFDVADVKQDARVKLRVLAELGDGFPHDNYEGLAITQDDGAPHVWLVSDDNFMTYQRSLLLKLRWDQRRDQRQKARK